MPDERRHKDECANCDGGFDELPHNSPCPLANADDGCTWREDLLADSDWRDRLDPEDLRVAALAADSQATQSNEGRNRLPPLDLSRIKAWLSTVKRLPAPPSAVEYVEQLVAEVEWLRAWVPPPPGGGR